MSEIVDMVVQKTGLSQDVAQQAVDAVLSFVKGKLPASLAGELDNLVAGNASGIEGAAEGFLKGKLGSLFGGGSDAK